MQLVFPCRAHRSPKNCRYCTDRAQNLPGPAPNIWRALFQMSSKSTRQHLSFSLVEVPRTRVLCISPYRSSTYKTLTILAMPVLCPVYHSRSSLNSYSKIMCSEQRRKLTTTFKFWKGWLGPSQILYRLRQ